MFRKLNLDKVLPLTRCRLAKLCHDEVPLRVLWNFGFYTFREKGFENNFVAQAFAGILIVNGSLEETKKQLLTKLALAKVHLLKGREPCRRQRSLNKVEKRLAMRERRLAKIKGSTQLINEEMSLVKINCLNSSKMLKNLKVVSLLQLQLSNMQLKQQL
ncbi:hypothetical protein PVK06_038243 [Gossypium arboreum]|uniref:Uncharacterized protein n=1 Tax=Gossypium arboreum TaxID=29729 RepID=A0ABR0MZZ4_GOSAR|nr:hypothetical protein PVK06_038243 [Gossypium arboreum]